MLDSVTKQASYVLILEFLFSFIALLVELCKKYVYFVIMIGICIFSIDTITKQQASYILIPELLFSFISLLVELCKNMFTFWTLYSVERDRTMKISFSI